ncbi:hypothetical protein AB0H58_20305 [Nocardia neocaledoniensis]|jgi:hypothetical protein|uniref:Uncharacterized protein n=1 Tax=Nocardia neocaledoniensis TaxID=236511 RepID=A0A317NPJ6_9NOCA|nr:MULTISPECIES: hypothetical protein [Nocardia]PWV76424.1 hypothetical protein DFR69_104531 [Nocardia neocaledoniensis]UGT52728.1 hypothetical protein LTT85_18585 [Nocardia asteroides]GEM33001.1 hypothetical protein NN3_40080 [Nocardia neocaledoniensis NBRC 108232]
MKTLGLIAAGIAVTTVTIMGAGPAHADFTDPVELTDSGENTEEGEFGEYAIDVNHPGSCLVVQNHTGGRVTLRLNYPTSGGKWQFAHDEVGVLSRKGKVVTSPSGRWNVRTNPPIRFNWVYDDDLNDRKGCNGSWVLTMN